MLMAKSCHDVDWLRYVVGKQFKYVVLRVRGGGREVENKKREEGEREERGEVGLVSLFFKSLPQEGIIVWISSPFYKRKQTKRSWRSYKMSRLCNPRYCLLSSPLPSRLSFPLPSFFFSFLSLFFFLFFFFWISSYSFIFRYMSVQCQDNISKTNRKGTQRVALTRCGAECGA